MKNPLFWIIGAFVLIVVGSGAVRSLTETWAQDSRHEKEYADDVQWRKNKYHEDRERRMRRYETPKQTKERQAAELVELQLRKARSK